MKRLYENLLQWHFQSEDKMAFLSGPRQVGKTTTSREVLKDAVYLNWDNQEHRSLILKGPAVLFKQVYGEELQKEKKKLIFDEIHKYRKWKNFLKGFFDTYSKKLQICVTGSARLNIYKYGGDSLMGRYFPYRIHPLSVRELLSMDLPQKEISSPLKISSKQWDSLLQFGGYPEPFLRSDSRFYNRWKRLRLELLLNQDIRDLSSVSDISRIQVLAQRLIEMASGILQYSHLANDIQVSVDTIRRWLNLLEVVYFSFRIRPFSTNVTKSLLKEPKVYLWDWAFIQDRGRRIENFVASHLLKAVHLYTDLGFGDYDLYYLRDKNKREVDFLVTKDKTPWFLVEVKSSEQPITDSLHYFKKILNAPFAFQAVFNKPFIDKDCFSETAPVIVPLQTLLSQLV
jgi:uncharacterized protein